MSTMPAGRLNREPAFRRLYPSTFDVHAISIPARGFTGDFYFLHPHADRLWFALGDVAGKGLPAAVVMAMIQEELEQRIESCAASRCHPSTTMQRLHRFLQPLVPRNRFATAVIGHLSGEGTIEIANGGHCPPLIARPGGIDRIGPTGPILGPLDGALWTTFETTLGAQDSLVLYSDGVLEAESPEGEEFGIERIEECIRGASATEIGERIASAVNRHSGGIRHDDLTVLVVRR